MPVFSSLFQAWADAFRSSPDLTGVVQVYEELKRKGIEFPTSDHETLSPIHTPQRVGGFGSLTKNLKSRFILLFLELFFNGMNVDFLCRVHRNLYSWYLCNSGLCTNQAQLRNNYLQYVFLYQALYNHKCLKFAIFCSFISVSVLRRHLLQRATRLCLNMVTSPVSQHHKLSPHPTAPLRSPTFMLQEPSTRHRSR